MFDSIIIKRKKKKKRKRRQDEGRIPLHEKIVFKRKKTSEEVNLYYRTLAKGSTDIYVYIIAFSVIYFQNDCQSCFYFIYVYIILIGVCHDI